MAGISRKSSLSVVITETTDLGSAYLAGLATGFWKSCDELDAKWQFAQRYTPSMGESVAPAIFWRIAGKPWWGTKGECSGWIVNLSGWAMLEFCIALGIRNVIANPVSENVGTFVLVFAVLFLVISVFGLGALYALPVGLMVLAIG